MQPFINKEFNLTAGGGYLIEEDSIIIPFKNTKKFSFFPGKILYDFNLFFDINDV